MPGCEGEVVSGTDFEPFKQPGKAWVCKSHYDAANSVTRQQNGERLIRELANSHREQAQASRTRESLSKESGTTQALTLIEQMQSVAQTLGDTISKTIGLRVQAAGFEGPAGQIENDPESSEAERVKAEELRASAERLREQAHASKLKGLSLFGKLRELKENLDIRLLSFGDDGQRLRNMLDGIQFSSWSAARGWPLATDDEGGMQRGLATLEKILVAILEMFPGAPASEVSCRADQAGSALPGFIASCSYSNP